MGGPFLAVIQVLDDRRQGPRKGQIQRVIVSRTSIPTCPREEVIRVILLKAYECAFGVVLVLLVWPILSAPMMSMGAVSTQVGPTSRIMQHRPGRSADVNSACDL